MRIAILAAVSRQERFGGGVFDGNDIQGDRFGSFEVAALDRVASAKCGQGPIQASIDQNPAAPSAA